MLPIWFLASSCICLFSASGSVSGDALHRARDRGHASLNEMLREVEMLMEDTQQRLEEAVDQIATESAKSSQNSLDILSKYHNDSKRIAKDGNEDVRDQHATDKVLADHWNSSEHECMVSEDCGEGEYCLYEMDSSRCLPCIVTDMPCTKDEECCSEQMCVYGQCTVNATPGAEGTICQYQSDCDTQLCCAFLRELLFPVCSPRPERGDPCHPHPNLLMDLLAWDQEGPWDHCPCAHALSCHANGRGSSCGK